MRRKKHFGFTLMEILIAIAILGILAVVGMGNFFSSLKKGRDARRKVALEQVQKALEMYYNDYGQYPDTSDIDWGEEFTDGTTTYMKKLPQDPKDSYQYVYAIDSDNNGVYFKLYACLENDQDLQIITPSETVDCGGCENNCNYGISSPNTEP